MRALRHHVVQVVIHLTFLHGTLELDKENHRIEREEKAAERREVQRHQTATQEQFNALLSQQTSNLELLAENMNIFLLVENHIFALHS